MYRFRVFFYISCDTQQGNLEIKKGEQMSASLLNRLRQCSLASFIVHLIVNNNDNNIDNKSVISH